MRAALADAGMPAAAIDAHVRALALPPEDVVELDADDEGQSVALFVALEASWHRAPAVAVPGVGMIGGDRTGLILSEIRPAAEVTGVTLDPARFADLRAMEAAALKVWAARR